MSGWVYYDITITAQFVYHIVSVISISPAEAGCKAMFFTSGQ